MWINGVNQDHEQTTGRTRITLNESWEWSWTIWSIPRKKLKIKAKMQRFRVSD